MPARCPHALNLYSARDVPSASRSEHTEFGLGGAFPEGSFFSKQFSMPFSATGNRALADNSAETARIETVSKARSGNRNQSSSHCNREKSAFIEKLSVFDDLNSGMPSATSRWHRDRVAFKKI